MIGIYRRVLFPMFLLSLLTVLCGCPIPQQPGKGKTLLRKLHDIDRHYYLYIPENYNSERRYPLVVSLHGMKPYDTADHHPRMWGKLADEYGYLVLAPILQTSDSFGQFPLRQMGSAEKRDVRYVIQMMDEVMQDWQVERNSVLLSSWSMGGYLANYVFTEYGDRFSAFAPLQSNFNSGILDPAQARRFAGQKPVFVFYGTVDFPGVTSEAKKAVEWYRSLGYTVRTKDAPIGHQRHPELAAQFFEQVLSQARKNVQIVVTPPNGEPAPLAVNLWPALSSKIGEVRTYIWDFGRLGGPSYMKSPNVLIRQPGNYPIRLTVIDAGGQRHSAQTILNVPAAASASRTGSSTSRPR